MYIGINENKRITLTLWNELKVTNLILQSVLKLNYLTLKKENKNNVVF